MSSSQCLQVDCEREWIFGAPGVCNNVTEQCDCPAGFTGTDEFASFEDCHWKVDTLKNIYLGVVIMTGISIVVLSILFIRHCCILSTLRQKALNEEVAVLDDPSTANEGEALSSSNGGSKTGAMNSGRATPQMKRKKLRNLYVRKKTIAWLYVFYSICLIGKLPLEAALLVDPENISSRTFYISNGIMEAAYYIATWLFMFVLYSTLPNAPWLCRLLDIQSIFVKYPRCK